MGVGYGRGQPAPGHVDQRLDAVVSAAAGAAVVRGVEVELVGRHDERVRAPEGEGRRAGWWPQVNGHLVERDGGVPAVVEADRAGVEGAATDEGHSRRAIPGEGEGGSALAKAVGVADVDGERVALGDELGRLQGQVEAAGAALRVVDLEGVRPGRREVGGRRARPVGRAAVPGRDHPVVVEGGRGGVVEEVAVDPRRPVADPEDIAVVVLDREGHVARLIDDQAARELGPEVGQGSNAGLEAVALGDDLAVVVAVDVDREVGERSRVGVDGRDVVGHRARRRVEEDVGEGLPEHRCAARPDIERAAAVGIGEEVADDGGGGDRLQHPAPADVGGVRVDRDARGAGHRLGDVVAGVGASVGEHRLAVGIGRRAARLGVGAGDVEGDGLVGDRMPAAVEQGRGKRLGRARHVRSGIGRGQGQGGAKEVVADLGRELAGDWAVLVAVGVLPADLGGVGQRTGRLAGRHREGGRGVGVGARPKRRRDPGHRPARPVRDAVDHGQRTRRRPTRVVEHERVAGGGAGVNGGRPRLGYGHDRQVLGCRDRRHGGTDHRSSRAGAGELGACRQGGVLEGRQPGQVGGVGFGRPLGSRDRHAEDRRVGSRGAGREGADVEIDDGAIGLGNSDGQVGRVAGVLDRLEAVAEGGVVRPRLSRDRVAGRCLEVGEVANQLDLVEVGEDGNLGWGQGQGGLVCPGGGGAGRHHGPQDAVTRRGVGDARRRVSDRGQGHPGGEVRQCRGHIARLAGRKAGEGGPVDVVAVATAAQAVLDLVPVVGDRGVGALVALGGEAALERPAVSRVADGSGVLQLVARDRGRVIDGEGEGEVRADDRRVDGLVEVEAGAPDGDAWDRRGWRDRGYDADRGGDK